MVTLSFEFDEDKVEAAGYTCDELLQEMRDYAEEQEIEEINYGVFAKSGEDAACQLGMAVVKLTMKYTWYIDTLKSWVLDINGRKENCIEEAIIFYERENIIKEDLQVG